MASPTKEQLVAQVEKVRASPEALEQMLLQVFVNDTAQIKAAEEVLKLYIKKAASIPALMNALRSSPQPQARQLAGVLLKKKMMTFWDKFTPQQKEEIKAALIQMVGVEPERLVRHAIASLMSKIAKACFVEGQPPTWNELLAFAAQCAAHQSEELRELAFILLHELTETIGDVLTHHFDTLLQLFLNALQDPSPKVQIAALEASSALQSYVSEVDEGEKLGPLILPTIQVARHCVAQTKEDIVCNVLDLFVELAQSHLPTIHPFLGEVVDFTLEVVRNGDLEMSTRDSACLVLSTLAEWKPKLLGKTGKVPAILQVMVELIASYTGSAANALFTYEALGDDGEEDEDYDGPNPQNSAQNCLDALALHMPMKYVFEPSMLLFARCFQDPNPHVRKAGVALVGVVTEGCQELIRSKLDQILPPILQAAQDPEAAVRECACFCLGQFSEHCQPDVLEFHQEILPVVFNLLDDATDNVKGVSCYVLEMFCENLQPETVRPFLDPLMRRLVIMLQTPKKSIQEMSVAAIAATAVAAEQSFLPYLQGVAAMLLMMLTITDESMLSLRGRALECMGHIAIAVEAENFQPYVTPCMACAVEGLKIDSLELHEYAYTFFANLAKVLEMGMATFLPELVPHLLSTITESDGGDVDADDQPEEKSGLAAFADDDDSEDDEDAAGNMVFNVRTAVLDKKKAAMLALGALAEHVPAAFEPHLGKTMEMLTSQADYWHTDIRSEVCDTLKNMVGVSLAVYPLKDKWVKGQAIQLAPHTQQLTGVVVTMLTKIMAEDTEREVVAHACEAFQHVLETVGFAALFPVAQFAMETTQLLLKEESPCQLMGPEDDEDEAEEERDEGDEGDRAHVLGDAVADLVATYAKVTGAGFVPYFDTFLPLLLKYAKGSRPASDRSMAIGCCAEVLEALETASPKYVPDLLPVVRKGLADGDTRVRRNSAYCAGVMAQWGGSACIPHYMALLQALAPLFSNAQAKLGPSEGAVLDNAASAVARMIMTSPQSIPLNQVLPLFLTALPLKSDHNEDEMVWKCVLGLLQMKQADALAHLPTILVAAAQALADKSGVSDDCKAIIASGLKAAGSDPHTAPQMSAAIGQLPQEARDVLAAKVQ